MCQKSVHTRYGMVIQKISFSYMSLFHQDLLHLGLTFSRRSPSLTNAYSVPCSVTIDNSKSKEKNKDTEILYSTVAMEAYN